MPVTVTQSPTSPNAAYTRLVYVASGSVTISEPQYQYVMDVYQSGSNELINRITQVPNPAGVAVFDPSPIIQGQLDVDNIWKTSLPVAAVNTSKTFDIRFGEQYGTSDSSSVTVYTGSTPNYLDVFPGIVNENNGTSFNFQSSSYITLTDKDAELDLSNDPYIVNTFPFTPAADYTDVVKAIGTGDYETVSSLNNYIDKVPDGLVLFDVKIYVWGTGSLANPPTALGTADIYRYTNQFSFYELTGSLPGNLVHIPTGPKNFSSAPNRYTPTISTYPTMGDVFNSGKWAWYNVEAWYTTDVNNPTTDNYVIMTNSHINEELSDSDYRDSVNYWNQQGAQLTDLNNTFRQPTCNKEKTRFAFINRYGVWDYFNVYNPVKTNTDLERESFDNSFVNYSNQLSPYSANRRGEKQTYLASTDRYSVDTFYLDKEMANWLEELMESPSVYLQEGDNFVPIIITNTQYQTNNSTARNKLFQYTIEWEYANARRSRI